MSLLGDLFEDIENSTILSETCNRPKNESGMDNVPSTPRPSIGFCGIVNQGATCYLNSLIQTLVMTPEFRESLFHVQQNELGCLKDKDTPGVKVRVIPVQLQQLFAQLLLLDVQAVKSADLTDSFGWTNAEEAVQHDVQELNRILFCAVEDSLVGTSGEKLIQNLYHGTIANEIRCEECMKLNVKEEDFLDLCVAVAGCSGLEESLIHTFVTDELLNDANRYSCSNCSKLTNAVKRTRLRRLPPILTISLLRFSFDLVKMERYKEIGKFSFPMKLNMAKYCENNGGSDFNAEYELFSVVIHRGSTHGGHYHAYIRDIDGIGNWIHPDNEELYLVPTGKKTVPSDVIECNSCESLIESILQRSDKNSGMTVDALCSEIVKQTGVSWNKRFKKQHGPITKFLKSHHDHFVYNQDANWVSLNKAHSVATERSDGDGDLCDKGKFKKQERVPPASLPDPGHCWFDFDDVHIRPIVVKDLESQFSGKESAYMLFYRNQSLVRPPEAFHNPGFGIPEQIICDIVKQNTELEHQRCLYKTQKNIISIQVHFGSSYFYSSGSLQPCDDLCTFIEVSIDRRKSVSDLLTLITDELPHELVGESRMIHIAKETPSGLHLYQSIMDDTMATLASCGIENAQKVFLWDGFQVGGEPVATGYESEPVLLNIICSNSIQFSSGFPKNLAVEELKEAISLRCGIPYKLMHLTLLADVDADGKSGKSSDVLFNDETKTLVKLGLENFNQLYVTDVSSVTHVHIGMPQVVVAQSSYEFTFMIENRCLDLSAASGRETLSVKAGKETMIAELKATALSLLDIPLLDPALTRLRMKDQFGLKPPLYEHNTISASELADGSQLLLEPGPPPMPNQVMLVISVMKMSKVTKRFELITNKAVKVGQLLETAVTSAALESFEWHLCRLDWNDEPVEILDDVDLSVEECHLNHGDHLSLEFGYLPPKGFLQLCVYLYPRQTNWINQQEIGSLQHLSDIMDQLTFHCSEGRTELQSSSEECNQTIFKPLGTVVVSKLATLLDLKEQIMTLDGLSGHSIPSPKFLRLRLLRSKQLGEVLRHHLQTLQKLKLVNGCEIGVQLLVEEEDLSQNHMLLVICLRCDNERKYLEDHELIWDISKGATFANLRKAVANIYNLPEHNVFTAKHVKEKYEWIILNEQNAIREKTNDRGKKKGRNGSDLRQKPFNLQDGDSIGVRVLHNEVSVSADDFGTKEDDAGKEKIKKEADSIRKLREEKQRRDIEFYDAISTNQHKRRSELAIKIHVDNFS